MKKARRGRGPLGWILSIRFRCRWSRVRFDVTFQFREYPHILLSERVEDEGLHHLQ